MGIPSRIRADLNFLHASITALRNDLDSSHIDNKTREVMTLRIEEQSARIVHLEAILGSGKIPHHYTTLRERETIMDERLDAQCPEEILPVTEHSIFCSKKSRKNHRTPYSFMNLYYKDKSPKSAFFVDHSIADRYPEGGLAARVKKAWKADIKYDYHAAFELKLDRPDFALKIFRNTGDGTSNYLRMGMRGAFCNRLLGRSGLAFRRAGKIYLLMDWLRGRPLNEWDSGDVMRVTFDTRLLLMCEIIKELAVLHRSGIVHGDIKPGNVMFDPRKCRLNLFDFDSVRLHHEVIKGECMPVYTPDYLPPRTHAEILAHRSISWLKIDTKVDIYSLGICCAVLFPEIFYASYAWSIHSVETEGRTRRLKFPTVTVNEQPTGVQNHPEVYNLITAMLNAPDLHMEITDYLRDALALLETLSPRVRAHPRGEQVAQLTELENYNEEIGKNAFHTEIEREILCYADRDLNIYREFCQDDSREGHSFALHL